MYRKYLYFDLQNGVMANRPKEFPPHTLSEPKVKAPSFGSYYPISGLRPIFQ